MAEWRSKSIFNLGREKKNSICNETDANLSPKTRSKLAVRPFAEASQLWPGSIFFSDYYYVDANDTDDTDDTDDVGNGEGSTIGNNPAQFNYESIQNGCVDALVKF